MSGKVKKSSCLPAGAAQAPGSLAKVAAAKRGERFPLVPPPQGGFPATPAPLPPGTARLAPALDEPPAGAKAALRAGTDGAPNGDGEGGRNSSGFCGGAAAAGEYGGEEEEDAAGLKSLANTVPRSSTATFMMMPPPRLLGPKGTRTALHSEPRGSLLRPGSGEGLGPGAMPHRQKAPGSQVYGCFGLLFCRLPPVPAQAGREGAAVAKLNKNGARRRQLGTWRRRLLLLGVGKEAKMKGARARSGRKRKALCWACSWAKLEAPVQLPALVRHYLRPLRCPVTFVYAHWAGDTPHKTSSRLPDFSELVTQLAQQAA